jgi:hypothetical protein
VLIVDHVDIPQTVEDEVGRKGEDGVAGSAIRLVKLFAQRISCVLMLVTPACPPLFDST